MKLNQALFRIRKSTLFVLMLFAISMSVKLIEFINKPSPVHPSKSRVLSPITSYICTNIVSRLPVDVRYEFLEQEKEIYYYTKSDSLVHQGMHLWYNGNTLVLQHSCAADSTICISSIPRSNVYVGEWSVDYITNKRLLDSRQFLVAQRPIL